MRMAQMELTMKLSAVRDLILCSDHFVPQDQGCSSIAGRLLAHCAVDCSNVWSPHMIAQSKCVTAGQQLARSCAGVYKTLANIFISFMGAGILGLPYAFRHSGLVLGTAFMLVLSMLAYYAIILLVACKQHLEHRGVVRPFTLGCVSQ